MKKFKDIKHRISESAGQLHESHMGELHADIGKHMDKHIDAYKKSPRTARKMMSHAAVAAKKISGAHGITVNHAHQFVRDYIQSRLDEEYIQEESKPKLKTTKNSDGTKTVTSNTGRVAATITPDGKTTIKPEIALPKDEVLGYPAASAGDDEVEKFLKNRKFGLEEAKKNQNKTDSTKPQPKTTDNKKSTAPAKLPSDAELGYPSDTASDDEVSKFLKDKQYAVDEQYQVDEMTGAGMSARAVHKHLKSNGWSLTRTSGGHDVFTHPKSTKNVAVPRHKGDLNALTVIGIMKTAKISEDTDYGQFVSEGAPELLKAEMPLVHHVNGVLAHYGIHQDHPEYTERFNHTISFLRKFGNVDAIKRDAAKKKMTEGAELNEYFSDVKPEDKEHDPEQYKRYHKMFSDALRNGGQTAVNTVANNARAYLHSDKAPRSHRNALEKARKDVVGGRSVSEEYSTLHEGRPSQAHPLEGHEYHTKSDAELTYIAKDAHKAAEAMKGHNTAAENKYRDQASDAATVRYWRQKNGMATWYRKKYGHLTESTDSAQLLKNARKKGKKSAQSDDTFQNEPVLSDVIAKQ